MRRMAGGDETALGILYDELGGWLFALARRITRRDREAEEVIQEVFMAAWREAKTFDGASAATWLAALARSRAIDRLRARRRRLSFIEADEPPSPPSPAPADDRREQVAEWIDELPAPQRQAVELAFFGGFTHPEIAARLHETIGAVKSRVRLGLDHLRSRRNGGRP